MFIQYREEIRNVWIEFEYVDFVLFSCRSIIVYLSLLFTSMNTIIEIEMFIVRDTACHRTTKRFVFVTMKIHHRFR
jgi:hypothetical protein